MAHSDLPTDDDARAAALPFPTLREVGFGAPLTWVGRGFADLKANPTASLFYGFCFAGMGLLVTFIFEHAYQYTSAATTGFLLMAPFFAMGCTSSPASGSSAIRCGSLRPSRCGGATRAISRSSRRS